jgi:hypothetical protein
MDTYLLPFLSLMYFFNSVDRSNLGNAKTDGMDKDLGFKGEQYSLLILLFYVPNGLCDLPLNMLTAKWSGRVMLPSCKSTKSELERVSADVGLGSSNARMGRYGIAAMCCAQFRWATSSEITSGCF